MRSLIFPAILALAACSTSPVLDVANERSVSVRYDPLLVSTGNAVAKAEGHCRGMGLNPQLVSRDEDGGWRIINFHCVP